MALCPKRVVSPEEAIYYGKVPVSALSFLKKAFLLPTKSVRWRQRENAIHSTCILVAASTYKYTCFASLICRWTRRHRSHRIFRRDKPKDTGLRSLFVSLISSRLIFPLSAFLHCSLPLVPAYSSRSNIKHKPTLNWPGWSLSISVFFKLLSSFFQASSKLRSP